MSKNLYLNILFHVFLITMLCAGTSYFYFSLENNVLAFSGLLAILIVTTLLIRYLNKTNRRLAYFNESIKNEDTSITFPNDIKNKPIEELYKSLNHVNEIIRDAKVESEYNEKMLKTMIEYSSTGFINIEESGNFNVMNNAARKYLNVEHTSNLDRLKQFDPHLYKIINNLSPGETRIHRIQREDEHYNLSISLAVIKFYEKTLKVISMQDISSELEEQELESWYKLFRVITHEIMNSIAPITSLSKTLTRYFAHNGKQKSPNEIDDKTIANTLNGLQIIDNMSNGLMNFVQNYRQLNKIPKPIIEKIELKPWLTDLKTIMLEMIKGKNIDLKITVNNDCQAIHGDKKLLNQVILNLINNSIESFEKTTGNEINIRVYLSDNGKTILNLSDNGKGISKVDMEKVFVPFFTTKENGNGIGLSLSKQIMRLHGGSIMIKSKEKEGTQVILNC